MQESARVEEWLYTVLSGDAALAALVSGVYGYLAPQGTASPWVTFSHQAGTDVMVVGTARIMTNFLYQVKATGSGESMAALKAVADRIDAVLQAASGTVSDGRIISCVREQDLVMVETDLSGTRWNHAGGIYRIYAQPL